VTFDRRLAPFDLFHHTDYAVTPLVTHRRVVTLYDTAWLPHRGYVEPRQSRIMERAVRALLQGDPEVVALSEFAKADLVDCFRLDPSRVHVTPLASDPVFTEPIPADAIASAQRRAAIGPPYVISLGTLEPRKNLVNLIRAVDLARRQVPELGLVLLGRKGFRHEEVLDAAARSNLGSRFKFLGSIPDAAAAALVKGASTLAFPSVFEGFGLPAIEGMAAGVPVIASDIPVMREICGDGARLVDTTSVATLAAAVRWAVTDPASSDLAKAGVARAAHFTWRRCAEKTLAAYRSLLQRL
jgi:alpha-1,3-rhamnosyl/mannosyltransferase